MPGVVRRASSNRKRGSNRMNDDKTILAPIEVPGMQINFQSPIGPSGKVIAFVMGVDALIPLGRLNEQLDTIARAVRRQDAGEQLLLDRNHLAANRKLLAKAKAARDATAMAHESKLTLAGSERRRAPDPTKIDPHGVSALSQRDQEILNIEGQIAGCEERIPFWEGILRGDDPLDLPETPAMAAE
jgi:hypothetical protein